MAGWFRDAELAPDERLVFRRAATLHQGRRSVGGEVCVTDRRVLFVPNQLEALTRGRPFSVDRAEVTSAAVVAPVSRPPLTRLLAGRAGQAEIATSVESHVLTLAEPAELVRVVLPTSDAPTG